MGGGGPPMHDAQGGAAPGAGAPGAGGGGQRGPANQGLTGLLSNEAVAAELNLTDEQKEKIAAFAETMQVEGAGMREIFEKMRDASDEERQTLRDQIAALRAEINSKTLAGLSDILDEQQLTRLQQINWQREGAAALTSLVVMEKLGLSEEQQTKLADLSQKQNSERRELGFQASPEERQALSDKYNAEYTGVLTAEQSTAWNELLGEKFELPAE
jgi:Spy/CpxP family protein refolding chaperone